MKQIAMMLLMTICWSQLTLALEIDSTQAGVQILREQVRGAKGQLGYAYSARNANAYSIEVKIFLIESDNAFDGLLQTSQFVYPRQTVYLGPVIQLDPTKPYSWRYGWEAKATRSTGESAIE